MDNMTFTNTIDIDPHAKIIHDIKAPLNIILSSAEMLRMKLDLLSEDTQPLRQYIHYIEQSSHRLLRLSDSLLTADAHSAHHTVLRTALCDIGSFLDCIQKDFRPYVRQFGVELHLKNELSRPCILAFDRDLIERLLWNLLTNSLKHMNRGGSITLRLHSDHDYVYISLIDTGEGISDALAAEIFDPHITDGRPWEHNISSHGLGLPIVQELAELHEGSISVSSSSGNGSCFTFSISRHLSL